MIITMRWESATEWSVTNRTNYSKISFSQMHRHLWPPTDAAVRRRGRAASVETWDYQAGMYILSVTAGFRRITLMQKLSFEPWTMPFIASLNIYSIWLFSFIILIITVLMFLAQYDVFLAISPRVLRSLQGQNHKNTCERRKTFKIR